MSTPIFSSTARLARPFQFLMGGIVIMQIGIAVLVRLFPGADDGGVLLSLIVPGLILLMCFSILAATTRLTITEDHVAVKTFGIFSTTINREDIQDAWVGKPTRLGTGAGLRIMGNNTTGYLTGGPNVVIETRDGARTAVSTPNPEHAVATLKTSARTP
ncbi:hypothetical protein HF984_07280 [Rothia terrae]|uniref:hypothetical protein n=1 Tax=Rothia terrae TaxID=396015 RepID=UPI001447C488|nr:hypothetical protein [Rothia terrae]NKZ34563.1 hypothetical protein [Rothia terrae]